MALPSNTGPILKALSLAVAVIIIIVSAVLCQQIITNSIANQKNKSDFAELNHAKYGFLSIDEWKAKITPIIEFEINKLYLSKTTEQALRKHHSLER